MEADGDILTLQGFDRIDEEEGVETDFQGFSIILERLNRFAAGAVAVTSDGYLDMVFAHGQFDHGLSIGREDGNTRHGAKNFLRIDLQAIIANGGDDVPRNGIIARNQARGDDISVVEEQDLSIGNDHLDKLASFGQADDL